MTKHMSKETLEIVKNIRALLSGPDKWTKGWFARTASGNTCNAKNPDATCWCLAGAFEKVSNKQLASFAYDEFRKQFPNREIASWNDEQRTWETVRDMLDSIIRKNS